MSCHVMSCHVMSCHVMSCHVMSCHVMSCHVMSCHVMSCHVMSCHVMSCHVMSCHVMSCHVMSCHVMSCHVMDNVCLTVGYSTCHWCHVMERETFESTEIGEILNKHFISIKVDREERPDIDKIYMTFIQVNHFLTGTRTCSFIVPSFIKNKTFICAPRLI